MHQLTDADLAHERHELEKAERDLVEGDQRVARQREIINRLSSHGHDTSQAIALLANLEQMLHQWRLHRDAIVWHIATLERDQR